MSTSSLGRAALLAIVSASTASAQAVTAGRSSMSLSFIQSRPQGAFARNIGLGYGLDGAYLLRLDEAGIWSLRASIGGLQYGNESRQTALSETVGGRIQVNVTTTNYIMPMSVGPQVSWPSGLVRPYANAGVGGQAFLTESKVQGLYDLAPIASTINHSDFAASWSLGGGVYMPLVVGRAHVDLDLGVQYFAGGSARYLAAGSIVDMPRAKIAVTPSESTTHMTVIRLGVRVRP